MVWKQVQVGIFHIILPHILFPIPANRQLCSYSSSLTTFHIEITMQFSIRSGFISSDMQLQL